MSGRHRKPTSSAEIVAKIAFTGAVIGGGGLALAGHAAPPPMANGTRSRAANPAATGPSTPATATRAGCSSRPGTWACARRRRVRPGRATWPPRTSRSRSPSACWAPRAGARGRSVAAGCPARRRATSIDNAHEAVDGAIDAAGLNGELPPPPPLDPFAPPPPEAAPVDALAAPLPDAAPPPAPELPPPPAPELPPAPAAEFVPLDAPLPDASQMPDVPPLLDTPLPDAAPVALPVVNASLEQPAPDWDVAPDAPADGPQQWALHMAPPPLEPAPTLPGPAARRSAGRTGARSRSVGTAERGRHPCARFRRGQPGGHRSSCPLRPPTASRTWPARTNLPPGSTMDPARPAGDDSPNVSYLKDLWQAVQNQDISGKEALIMGLAQRGDEHPGPGSEDLNAVRHRSRRRSATFRLLPGAAAAPAPLPGDAGTAACAQSARPNPPTRRSRRRRTGASTPVAVP